MEELINKLKKKIKEAPNKCFFNEAVEYGYYHEFEDEHPLILQLPMSFITFLHYYNGGFISIKALTDQDDIETYAWNSNQILSLDELEKAYNRIEHKFYNSEYEFTPFLRTRIGEYLAFRYPYEGDESEVYDIWHEATPTEWLQQKVYDSFPDLLKDYIEKDGDIKTIG